MVQKMLSGGFRGHIRPTNLVIVTDYSKAASCGATYRVLGRELHLALGHYTTP